MTTAKGYALAHLRDIAFNDDIIAYLKDIDSTLEPYGGQFLVHGGGELDGREGDWDGSIVIIEFPSREAAVAWYESAEYQAILPLRTANTRSVAVIVEGVPSGYRSRDGLEALLPPHLDFDVTSTRTVDQ